jgi:hypothetical protein
VESGDERASSDSMEPLLQVAALSRRRVVLKPGGGANIEIVPRNGVAGHEEGAREKLRRVSELEKLPRNLTAVFDGNLRMSGERSAMAVSEAMREKWSGVQMTGAGYSLHVIDEQGGQREEEAEEMALVQVLHPGESIFVRVQNNTKRPFVIEQHESVGVFQYWESDVTNDEAAEIAALDAIVYEEGEPEMNIERWRTGD